MLNEISPLLLGKKEMLRLLSISSTTTLDTYIREGKVPPPSLNLGRYPRWHRKVVEDFYAQYINSSSPSPATHSTIS